MVYKYNCTTITIIAKYNGDNNDTTTNNNNNDDDNNSHDNKVTTP